MLGIYGLEIKKDDNTPHNYQAAIDGIYNFYKKHPNRESMKKVSESINLMIEVAHGSPNFTQIIFNIVEYIDYKQKQGDKLLNIDIEQCYKLMRDAIKMRRETKSKLYPVDGDFDQWYDQRERQARISANRHRK